MVGYQSRNRTHLEQDGVRGRSKQILSPSERAVNASNQRSVWERRWIIERALERSMTRRALASIESGLGSDIWPIRKDHERL